MHPYFQPLTPQWFKRAFVYTGSIGDFRYRFAHSDTSDTTTLHVAVYTRLCYEVADDVVERDFPWTDEGVAQLKEWVQARYEEFLAGS